MEVETRQLNQKIEETKRILEKLEVEKEQQQNANTTLQNHLAGVRSLLTQHFAGLPLPGTNETPTLHTVDSYMAKLHRVLLEHPENNDLTIIPTVREIVSGLSSAEHQNGPT